MSSTSTLDQLDRIHASPKGRSRNSAGDILLKVFRTLDDAGVRYCVSHGYEEYPDQIKSDVDCIIDRSISPPEMLSLLQANRTRIGADVVRCSGFYIVLAFDANTGPPSFLALDMSTECELDDLLFLRGEEVLRTRRRQGPFWVPAPDLDFACYLAKSIAKARLDEARTTRLSGLFRQDPAGCQRQLARFWSGKSADLIASAARSGDWAQVRQQLGGLRSELRRRAMLRSPGRLAANKMRGFLKRLYRVRQPDGVSVVLLGPDGAGKSSVVEALGPSLSDVLPRWTCWGFAPPLLGRLRHRNRRTDQPHGLPPRSYLTSVARAGYWLAFHTLGYARLRLALARSTLVLNDRHFVDILVDAKRYRYGGPAWLLRFIWRAIPKPDLVVLLDAPAEVLQARKQEVPFEVTFRQRRAYLSLVRDLPNGHVVDASQDRDEVTRDVSEVVLRHLKACVARRYGLDRHAEGSAVGELLHPPARPT